MPSEQQSECRNSESLERSRKDLNNDNRDSNDLDIIIDIIDIKRHHGSNDVNISNDLMIDIIDIKRHHDSNDVNIIKDIIDIIDIIDIKRHNDSNDLNIKRYRQQSHHRHHQRYQRPLYLVRSLVTLLLIDLTQVLKDLEQQLVGQQRYDTRRLERSNHRHREYCLSNGPVHPTMPLDPPREREPSPGANDLYAVVVRVGHGKLAANRIDRDELGMLELTVARATRAER